jgi:hypothetical protein
LACEHAQEAADLRLVVDDAGALGGQLELIASIEEPQVLAKILAHLEKTVSGQRQAAWPFGAPPTQALLI